LSGTESNRSHVTSEKIIDPTANVILLVEAAVKRLDDLRAAEMVRVDERLKIHTDYTHQLAEAEAKRIDAIRSVDVNAVSVASERATQQAAVLANQVAASADALRALVATTATTMAEQSRQLSSQLTDRLTQLERAQYEGKGRSGLSAPLLMLIAAMAGGIVTFLIQRAFQ